MDIGSRNQRLRETLEAMGLFVVPIFCESDPDRIDYMQVSAGLPECVAKGAQEPTSRAVAKPVARPKIGENVGASDGPGHNVVDLPTRV